MSEYKSVARVTALQEAIEAKTGATYGDLADGVQVLLDGYGQGGDTTAEDMLASRPTGEAYAYYNPRVTELGGYVFYYWSGLKGLDLPSVEVISGQGVFQASGIESVNLPKLRTVNASNAFNNCGSLKEITLPAYSGGLTNSMFSNCKSLVKADFRELTSIGSSVFTNCSALETLIIRGDSVPTAPYNFLSATKIATNEGFIYVPSALVDAYKSATNWSAYADQVRAIEDYPEITGG